MNYQTLERTIGHSFADIALLDLAMTHPSYALQHKCQDNQRLEFLGDAVLEICVSRVLYHKYPKLREGQLTRKRAALVCEANLARAATRLGLGSYLKLDRGEEVVGGRENPSILADTMEAVIAAVYLDAGMEEAAKLVDLAMDRKIVQKEQGDQILIYPATYNDYTENSPFPSVKENGADYLLTAGKMQDYIDLYARNEEDKKNPYFAPYIAEDLANQPDTLILTCEFDPLRDEGEAYGKRLKAAGNHVEIHRIKDALHGYFALGIKQLHVQESFNYINEFLKEETL